MIKKRIAEEDCQMRGWMLDGFPHTLKECEALKNAEIFPDKVIFLDSKHEELFERIPSSVVLLEIKFCASAQR